MGTAIAATTVGQLPVFLTGSLTPQIGRDLAFSPRGLGIAVAAFFASSALCSTTLGNLADRLGGRMVLRLGVLPAVAGGLWIGLGVAGPGGLVAALVVCGLANGAIQPAANRYLARTIAEQRQGFAFGVKQAAIPAATLLAGLAVPTVGATVGWRWAFLGLAGLATGVGLLVPWYSPAPKQQPAPNQPTSPKQPATPRTSPGGGPHARTALLMLAVGLGVGSAAVNALGSFFVSSAVHIGTSDSTAGLIAALGSVTSICMRLVIGARADRKSTGHLRLVAALSAGGALGLVLLALPLDWLLLPAALIGYGAGWGWAGLLNYAIVRTHPTAPGRASGIIQTGGSTGACLGPLGFALLVEHANYQAAWLTGAALLLLAAVIILIGGRTLHTTRPT